jgi:hypothetical protein
MLSPTGTGKAVAQLQALVLAFGIGFWYWLLVPGLAAGRQSQQLHSVGL